jgi:trigger factor
MTITQEKVDNLRSKVKINLSKDDYEPRVKKQIKNLAKSVQIKGFRPGMVPLDVVKKMYGNSVLAEELNKLLNDEVYKYINENHIEIIASPIPANDQKLDIDVLSMKDIDFTYEVGLAPDIDLGYIENSASFTRYKIDIEDKMIDDEVTRIRKRFATFEYPETVGENDILTFTIEELDGEGNLKPGGVSTVGTVTVDLLKEDAKTKVLPLKKQESLNYNVFDLMDRDRESMAKNVLNMNDLATLPEVGDKFKLTLNNITRSVPAEINEEFFVKVYGEGGIKSEEEMRNSIKADLEAYFDGRTDSYLVNDLYKGIIDNIGFPLPDDFLKKWIDVTSEKPLTAEEIEKEYPQFAKSLRWSLIQRKIVREQKIEITEEEVKDRVRINLIQQFHGYGLKGMGNEWIEQFVEKQMADKKVVSQTREQLLEDKVIGFIKSKANLKEQPITLDDFKKKLEGEPQG